MEKSGCLIQSCIPIDYTQNYINKCNFVKGAKIMKRLTILFSFLIIVSLNLVLCTTPPDGGDGGDDSTYTVTYDGNGYTGGVLPTDDNIYQEGDTVTVLANTGGLEKTGHTYLNWNTESDGSGTDYYADDTFTMPSENVTLYAKWSVIQYTLTYDANGAESGDVPGEVVYDYDADVTVSDNTGGLTKTGYAFLNWNTETDGSGTTYEPDTVFSMPAEDLTLYAQWEMLYVYVSLNGDDSNDGLSCLTPKETIQAGIDVASTNSIMVVCVATGTYNITGSINMTSGVSIYGGYDDLTDSSDWSRYPYQTEADRQANPTTITIGSGIAVNCNAVTNSTIEGFIINGHSKGINNVSGSEPLIQYNTINGGNSDYSYGVYNVSSSPTIQYNTISGGSGGNYSYGINNISGSQLILNNTISGGVANYDSYGISNSCDSTIKNNIIDGGSAGFSTYGVKNTSGCAPTIQNNTIDGGNGDDSYGINNFNSSPILQNNTIDGGSGSDFSYGLSNMFGGSSIIQNNIIFTSVTANGYGIYEDDASDPTILQNNDIFACPTALYYDEGTTDITDIANVNSLTDITTIGDNVSEDPLFVDQAGGDWHLTSSTSTNITEGGLDLSGEFTDDLDENTRTVPWSIGAYEYNVVK
jgi:uncharacterized repeat protein (TIGR02543 family)